MKNLKLAKLMCLALPMAIATGCSMDQASNLAGLMRNNNNNQGGGAVVGNGATVSGTGALSVPTANAAIARIQNGLEGSVNPMAGNFQRSLAQVRTNLPKVSDPTQASGYDQVQLLVYGACSDLTTGNTPIMQSRYGVTANGTIAANTTALVNAGMRMMDQYTAGLASASPATDAARAAFQSLVSRVGATATNTSRIAFMSVCIAANTAGSTLLGF
ncbi:hypothetical protein K2X30_10615 [bacterium]|jgi:hypothetical protein|nr:hypothetical protein [bacterium]